MAPAQLALGLRTLSGSDDIPSDQHLGFNPQLDNRQSFDPELASERQQTRQNLKRRFEHIFAKYERDFNGIGDEIDLTTGDIVVNNGHITNMRSESDTGARSLQGTSSTSRTVSVQRRQTVYRSSISNSPGRGGPSVLGQERIHTPRNYELSRDEQDDFDELCVDSTSTTIRTSQRPVPSSHARKQAHRMSSSHGSGDEVSHHLLQGMSSFSDSVRPFQSHVVAGQSIDPSIVQALGQDIAARLTGVLLQSLNSGLQRTPSPWTYPDHDSTFTQSVAQNVPHDLRPLPPRSSPTRESLWAPARHARPRRHSRSLKSTELEPLNVNNSMHTPGLQPPLGPSNDFEAQIIDRPTSSSHIRECRECGAPMEENWHFVDAHDVCEHCTETMNRDLPAPGHVLVNDDEDGLWHTSEDETDANGAQPKGVSRQRITGKNIRFSAKEDALLIKLKEIDLLSWGKIHKYFPTRTPYSLQCRYSRRLHRQPSRGREVIRLEWPGFDQDKFGDFVVPKPDKRFSKAEDDKILQLRDGDGLSWRQISFHVCGRGAEALQKRYKQLATTQSESVQKKAPAKRLFRTMPSQEMQIDPALLEEDVQPSQDHPYDSTEDELPRSPQRKTSSLLTRNDRQATVQDDLVTPAGSPLLNDVSISDAMINELDESLQDGDTSAPFKDRAGTRSDHTYAVGRTGREISDAHESPIRSIAGARTQHGAPDPGNEMSNATKNLRKRSNTQTPVITRSRARSNKQTIVAAGPQVQEADLDDESTIHISIPPKIDLPAVATQRSIDEANLTNDNTANQPPPHSWTELITLALQECSPNAMTTAEIVDHVGNKFPYYKRKGVIWTNNVYKELRSKEKFQSVTGRPKKWRLVSVARTDGANAGQKRPYLRTSSRQRSGAEEPRPKRRRISTHDNEHNIGTESINEIAALRSSPRRTRSATSNKTIGTDIEAVPFSNSPSVTRRKQVNMPMAARNNSTLSHQSLSMHGADLTAEPNITVSTRAHPLTAIAQPVQAPTKRGHKRKRASTSVEIESGSETGIARSGLSSKETASLPMHNDLHVKDGQAKRQEVVARTPKQSAGVRKTANSPKPEQTIPRQHRRMVGRSVQAVARSSTPAAAVLRSLRAASVQAMSRGDEAAKPGRKRSYMAGRKLGIRTASRRRAGSVVPIGRPKKAVRKHPLPIIIDDNSEDEITK